MGLSRSSPSGRRFFRSPSYLPLGCQISDLHVIKLTRPSLFVALQHFPRLPRLRQGKLKPSPSRSFQRSSELRLTPSFPLFSGPSPSFPHDLLLTISSQQLDFATATSIRFSPEGFEKFYRDWEMYKDRVLLRSQQVANSPEIIRRLGVVSLASFHLGLDRSIQIIDL
jgi:hypothetical protein